MATSNGILNGSTATASSEYAPTYAAGKAIDGNGTTFWSSADDGLPQWIKFDLGDGNAEAGYRYSITARNPTSNYLAAWTLEGSNDGVAYTTLDTQTGQSFSNAEKKTYTYSGTGLAYRYYKVNITASQSGSAAEIAEIGIDKYLPPQGNYLSVSRRSRAMVGGESISNLQQGGWLERRNRMKTGAVSRSPLPVFTMRFEGADEAQTFVAGGPWAGAVTITYGGEVRLDTAQYVKGGSSVEFDWNQNAARYDDFIKIADMPNFTLGDYTLSFNVRYRAVRNYLLVLQIDANYEYSPCLVANASSAIFTNSSPSAQHALESPVSLNTWRKVEQIVSRGVARIYQDDSLIGIDASFASGVADTTLDLYLGYGGPNVDNYPFSGWIDDLKIYDYAIR